MINHVTYPIQTQPFLAERYLAISLLLHEAASYPLDNITSRTISRQINVAGKSLFSYKESHIIALELFRKNKLYHGVFSGLDKCFFKNVCTYFVFQWVYFKFLYSPVVADDYQAEDYTAPYSPEHNVIYPLLKYVDYLDPRTHLAIFLATSFGTIITQPAHIVKIKAQNESVDERVKVTSSDRFKQIAKLNTSLLKTGLASRLGYNFLSFLIEGSLFQYSLRRSGFQFMNLYEQASETPNLTLAKALQLGLVASFAASTLLYPLVVYNHVEVLQGLRILPENPKLDWAKGYASYVCKRTTRHLTVLGVLWYTATEKNKLRMLE